MRVFMTTARMTMRRFTPDDLDHLYDLDNDPEVMRYLNGGEPTPRAVIEHEILPRFLHYDAATPGFGRWAAIETTAGDFLGWFSLLSVNTAANEAELGYRLRRAAWGRGLATEGAQALIDGGFSEFGVERVIATTYQDNLASQRVMQKIGMSFVRAFRLTPEDFEGGGSFHSTSDELWDGDDVEYALTRGEWEQQQRSRDAGRTA